MAMSQAGMATAIQNAITAASPIASPAAFANALATALYAYITANASVAVPATGLVAPAGGGAVTGAAVGTVS